MIDVHRKFTEKSEYGSNLQVRAILPHRAKALAVMGLWHAYQTSVDKKFLVVRSDNEPLHYDVVYVLEGELAITTEENELRVKPGDLFHLNSNIPRRIELVKGRRYHEIMFSFHGQRAPKYLKTKGISVKKATQLQEIRTHVDGYCREIRQRFYRDSHAANAYAELLAIHLQREMTATDSEDNIWKDRFHMLDETIYSDLASGWPVERMAEVVHISESHLYRVMQEMFQQSPRQYLTCMRIEETRNILDSTPYPLSAIAAMVGYANAYSLSNAFLRNTGLRPQQYRDKRKRALT